ncbi:MAG: hypothetical protein ACXVB9_13005 [Bdellovibrionota bacterium]
MNQLYFGTLISLAILVVPGIVIESYWWWNDRKRHEAERAMRRAENRPEGDEQIAA